ncbi:MAG TPA: hypothetical protein VN026_16945 [Bacteroidia bacterium]|jgi:hypothetical protein|nr:hypothetical protein [Bacteroidia bacterium]
MATLSKTQLAELNPENVYRMPFVMHFELWQKLDPNLSTHLSAPVKVLFDGKIRTKLGKVKNGKGIYMFIVEPDFPLTPKINYLMYIGRVINTNTFFKRFADYVGAIGDINKRRNIQLLTNLWPGKTWVYFYKLTAADSNIKKIERNLFDHIIPPLNNSFVSKKAQNSRSIYN